MGTSGRRTSLLREGGIGRREPQCRSNFAERLHLNASQAVRVDSILESFRQSFGQVQNGYWQTFHLKRDTLRLSIRALLAPEQNKLFDEYIKETDERDAKRRENPER